MIEAKFFFAEQPEPARSGEQSQRGFACPDTFELVGELNNAAHFVRCLEEVRAQAAYSILLDELFRVHGLEE